MPIDFGAIINDDKGFPDTLELTIGNEKLSLGAIRDLSKKQRQQVVEQLDVVQREREAVANQQRQAQEMTEKASGVYQTLQSQLEASKAETERNQAIRQTNGYDPEQMYQTDIWYGPIRKRDQGFEEQLKKIAEKLELVSRMQSAMSNTYVEDRFGNEYEATADMRKKSKQIADWDLEKLKKYAQENKINDRLGFTSIKEAVNRLTADEKRQISEDEIYQRGLREGEMRARMSMMRPPSAANAAMTGSEATPSTLDEALAPDSIAKDEELMRMFADLQQAGANLITGGTK